MFDRLQRWHQLWAFLSYQLWAVVLTDPVARQAASVLPSDVGDPVLNTWLLWWDSHVLPLTGRWWDGAFFYPTPNVLGFSESLLGILPISLPVQWVSGNPILAYNVAFLASFSLSALAAYLLCFELTGRRDAAWIAGLAYGFCPYRIDQMAHLQVLSSYWLPLVLLGLHRYQREGRVRWLVLFAGAYLLQGLANGYFLLFVPVLVGLWVIWFVRLGREWRSIARVATAGVAAVVLAAPVLLGYQAVREGYGLARSLDEIQLYSADVTAFLSPAPALRWWSSLTSFNRQEGQLFPGLTAVAVVLVGIVLAWRPSDDNSPRRRVVFRVCLAGTVLFGLVLASMFVFGPWERTIAGVRIIVTRVDKSVSAVAIFALGLLLASAPVVGARGRRSALAFYVLATCAVYLLCLGPFPRFLGEPILYQAPYAWLMRVPGFEGLRVPTRFWMLGALCLATAAGLAYARIAVRVPRWAGAACLVVSAGLAADGWMAVMPVVPAPDRFLLLERTASGPLMELPLGPIPGDAAAMYRAIFHGQRVVNGYSGFYTPFYPLLENSLATGEPDAVPRMAALGVTTVAVRRAEDDGGHLAARVAAIPGVRQVAADEQVTVFRVPSVPADAFPEQPRGTRVPVVSLTASERPENARRALDENRETRWDTGRRQQPGVTLTVDLGVARTLGTVVLELGPSVHDFPRALAVEVSVDGAAWEEACRGAVSSIGVTAAARHPLDVPLEFPLGGRSARFIRLTQLGSDPIFYWSVAELRVFEPAAR